MCRVTSKVLCIDAVERSWGDVKTIKSVKYLLSSVMYQRNIGFLIHLPVFNQLEFNNTILINNLMKIVHVITGMNMLMLLINN